MEMNHNKEITMSQIKSIKIYYWVLLIMSAITLTAIPEDVPFIVEG